MEDEEGGEVDMSFTNSYHTMDEYGGYCCVIPFKVTVSFLPAHTIHLNTGWFVDVSIESRSREEVAHIDDDHDGIEDYLQQQVEQHLIEELKSLGYKFIP